MSALGQAREDYLTARSNEDLADALLRISAISIDRAETLFAGVTFEHDHVRKPGGEPRSPGSSQPSRSSARPGRGPRTSSSLVTGGSSSSPRRASMACPSFYVRNNREGKDQ